MTHVLKFYQMIVHLYEVVEEARWDIYFTPNVLKHVVIHPCCFYIVNPSHLLSAIDYIYTYS